MGKSVLKTFYLTCGNIYYFFCIIFLLLFAFLFHFIQSTTVCVKYMNVLAYKPSVAKGTRIVPPAVYPHLANLTWKLNFRYESRLTQLRISKPILKFLFHIFIQLQSMR